MSKKAYAASNFTYDRERDVCICPHGSELTFRSARYRKDRDYHLRRYQCANDGCPHRTKCTKNKKGRTVDINQYREVVERQRVKQHLGFRRFTVSRLDNVQAQWAMLCSTYNLHKRFKRWESENSPLPPPREKPKLRFSRPSRELTDAPASRYAARQRHWGHSWAVNYAIHPEQRSAGTRQKMVFP